MYTPNRAFGSMPRVMIALLMLAGAIGRLSTTASANPYADLLNGYYSAAPSLPYMATPVTSAWGCSEVANDMWQRTWPLTAEQSTVSSETRAALAQQIRYEMTYLLAAETNGRWWWPESGREGDPNADRFILAAVMDAIKKLDDAGLFASDIPGWLATLRPAVDFQRAQYGNKTASDWSTKLAGEYPNMDAAYALIMGNAGLLYDNTEYAASGLQFIDAIHANVQNNGAVRYVGGPSPLNFIGYTNAVNVYTTVVIRYVSRYWALTADPTAHDILVSMAPYFPRALIAPGVTENSSAPWWKHRDQHMSNAGYMDVIAGISGDPQNKYIADALLDAGSVGVRDAVTAVDFWRSDIVGQKPEDGVLFPDTDIGGARGKFGRFSWVGTLAENQDTFVGAILTTNNLLANPSLESLQSNGMPISFGYYAASGNPILAIDQTLAHTGTKSVKITCTSQDRGVLSAPRLYVLPGHSYRLKVWYSKDSTIPASAIVARLMLWMNSSGTAESDKYAWQTPFVTAITGGSTQISGNNLMVTANQHSHGVWTSLDLTFQAPSSGGWLSIECLNWHGDGSVWFDDLSLVDVGDTQAATWDSSLLGVTPDIGMTPLDTDISLQTQAAYLSGNDYTRNGMVGAAGDFATLSVRYNPRRPNDGSQANWDVSQTWLMLPDRVVGRAAMTSLVAQSGPYVRMRIRTEPQGYATALDSTHFTSKQLMLHLPASTFPDISVGTAQSSDQINTPPDADDILLQETPATTHSYAPGQKQEIALDAHSTDTVDVSNYQALDDSALTGFRVETTLDTYDLWFNTGTTSANLNYALPTLPFQTTDRLYLTTTGDAKVVTPGAGLNGTAVNQSVPPGATACIVRNRNLLFNGGLEYISPSTNQPHGFNCYAASGSPVIATDTSVKRSGYRSLKITCGTADRGEAAAAAWSKVAGRSYQLTLWYQTDALMTAGGVKIRLMAWKNAGTAETDKIPWQMQWITSISGATVEINGNNLHLTPTVLVPGEWKPCTITFRLPATVTDRLTAEYFNWYGNGTVWFDDLTLIEAHNSLGNEGFESIHESSGLPTGYNCFAASGSPLIATDNTIMRTGSRSLRMTCGANARGEAFASPLTNVASKKYQLTVWYRTDEYMTVAGVVTRLMAWKSSGTSEADKVPWDASWIVASDGATAQFNGNNLHVVADSTAVGIWKCYTLTFRLPPPVVDRLTVECFNWNGNGTVWFDDVSVVEVP